MIDNQITNDYKFTALMLSLENTLDILKIPKANLEIKDSEWLFSWALLESDIDISKASIPDDREQLYHIFKSVSETIPSLNGSTSKFIETLMETYEILTKKYNPIIHLRSVDRRLRQYNTAS
jgi:hypothetical protein